MICPACGYDNIEGMDACENCTEPLLDLDVPRSDATTGLVRYVMEDDLRELEQQEPLIAQPGDSAVEVARRMKEAGARCALVLENGELAGIFTERGALQRLLSEAQVDTTKAQVRDVMTVHREVLLEADSVAAALNHMSIGGYLHVPVRRGDNSYTVVSIDQMLKYLMSKDW